jgi:hypothetical protein
LTAYPIAIKVRALKQSIARMAELVDAHGSGPCAARCGGSSPLPGTRIHPITFNKIATQITRVAFFIARHTHFGTRIFAVSRNIVQPDTHQVTQKITHRYIRLPVGSIRKKDVHSFLGRAYAKQKYSI